MGGTAKGTQPRDREYFHPSRATAAADSLRAIDYAVPRAPTPGEDPLVPLDQLYFSALSAAARGKPRSVIEAEMIPIIRTNAAYDPRTRRFRLHEGRQPLEGDPLATEKRAFYHTHGDKVVRETAALFMEVRARVLGSAADQKQRGVRKPGYQLPLEATLADTVESQMIQS